MHFFYIWRIQIPYKIMDTHSAMFMLGFNGGLFLRCEFFVEKDFHYVD